MTRLTRLFAIPALALGLALTAPTALMAESHGANIQSAVVAESLPESKLTKAGLYITAEETAALLAARDDVLLIDVRSPEETMLVGHPEPTDVNIPFKLIDPAHVLDVKKGSYKMMANPGFAPGVKTFLDGKDATAAIIMCRSGGRSADAVDALIEAGMDLPLYSMVDGFEGDKNDAGRREVNGWKNAGAPWTFRIAEGFLQGVE